ncbi:unnamed protein product [Sphagnum jensenii]
MWSGKKTAGSGMLPASNQVQGNGGVNRQEDCRWILLASADEHDTTLEGTNDNVQLSVAGTRGQLNIGSNEYQARMSQDVMPCAFLQLAVARAKGQLNVDR